MSRYHDLLDATVVKVLKKLFSKKIYIEEPDLALRNERMTQIGDQLKVLSYLKSSHSNQILYFNKDIAQCSFSIHSLDSNNYVSGFRIEFNEKNQLVISYHISYRKQPAFPFNGEYEIPILQAMFEKEWKLAAERRNAAKDMAIKKEKIKNLKHIAISGKIKEIAETDKFDYYILTYTNKLKLLVRLSKRSQIEIDIPFKNFQEALVDLRATIQSTIQLFKKNVKIKIISPTSGNNDIKWNKYSE
jgi:hypothetical protein